MKKQKKSLANKLLELSVYYLLDYNENRSECQCNEGYCRCTSVDPTINTIYYNEIYKEIYNDKPISTIKEYCIERAIRLLLTKDTIELYGESGYYGEDVAFRIKQKAKDKIVKTFNIIENGTDTEIIEYILTLEYGYVLPDLQNKTWKLDIVDIDYIYNHNYRHVNDNVIKEYKQALDDKEVKNLIILGIKGDNTSYLLIDGYHRFSASLQANKTKIGIIYCIHNCVVMD